jgi:hypothetical protein
MSVTETLRSINHYSIFNQTCLWPHWISIFWNAPEGKHLQGFISLLFQRIMFDSILYGYRDRICLNPVKAFKFSAMQASGTR